MNAPAISIAQQALALARQLLGRIKPNTVSPAKFGAIGDGVADDSNALILSVAEAVTTGKAIDLGSGRYRITKPLATLLTTPISINGDGPVQCQIIVDPSMAGDVLSFRNCWYGPELIITDANGTMVQGNPIVGRKRPNDPIARKSGVHLSGFSITGDRNTPNVQNGIVFYDRNDGVVLRDIEVEFVRGHGVVLSGLASNPTLNAATLIRESDIQNLHIRWCGDQASARPSLMMNTSSKNKNQSGWEFDDANNYVSLKNVKVVFSESISFQCNGYGYSTKHPHDNQIEIIVDSQRGAVSRPDYISGGAVSSANWSITNGVLAVTSGGTFTRITGVGQGDLIVGTFVINPNVPSGTYIAAINSGPAVDGTGSYVLANRYIDMSAYSVAASASNGICRFTTPMIECSGGHAGEKWDVTVHGSNVLNSNSVAIAFSNLPAQLNTDSPKPGNGFILNSNIGSLDVGVLLQSVSSMTITYGIMASAVPILAGSVTQSVSVNVGYIQSGRSREAFIAGSLNNLHVYPGNQTVVNGSDINTAMTPARWPNCFIILNNAGTLTRYVSIPQSPNFSTSLWTAV